MTTGIVKRSLSVALAFALVAGLAACGDGGRFVPAPPPEPPPLPTEPFDLGLINFRTSISAVAQAYALAQLAEDDGFSHVAVAYVDEAWGREMT